MAWNFKKVVGASILVVLLVILAWAYYPLLFDRSLTFKWEGALERNINFRDAGASINECIGREVLPEQRLLRSSRFYSGWSCDAVGNPDQIFSLDTYPEDGRRFYCRVDSGRLVGQSFQTVQLSDLEFEETWENHPAFVTATCKNISEILKVLAHGKRALIHCDAGRDRTGAVTALVAAYLVEEQMELNEVVIQGIECDYRKSRSLKPYKYGRVEAFLKNIVEKHGSVRAFLVKQCSESWND